MLEKVKVALPTLVNVAVRGALGTPTLRVPKLTVVELREKPAVETGISPVLPPPPQDTDHKVMRRQMMTKISALPQRQWSALAPIPVDPLARAPPASDGLFVVVGSAYATGTTVSIVKDARRSMTPWYYLIKYLFCR